MICGHAELSSNQPPANASWLAPGGDDGATVVATVAGAAVVGTTCAEPVGALVVVSVLAVVGSVSSLGSTCGASVPASAGAVAANSVLDRAGSSSARTTMRCDA